jgi:hypothetical protein
MLLEKDTILEAANSLLQVAILDEIEDVDGHASLPEGTGVIGAEHLADHIIKNHTEDVLLGILHWSNQRSMEIRCRPHQHWTGFPSHGTAR